MVNVIIVLILVILLSFAVKSSIRHFKGEGACCGGGSGTVKTKKPKKMKLDELKHAVEEAGYGVVDIKAL